MSAVRSVDLKTALTAIVLGTLLVLAASFIPDRFTLVPLFAALVLISWARRTEVALFALVLVLMLAQTQIAELGPGLRNLRWVGYFLLLAVGWHRLSSRVDPPPLTVLIPLIALVVLAGVSLAYSVNRLVTLGRWISLIVMGLALFGVVFREIDSTAKAERIALGFVAMAAGAVLVGLLYDLIGGGGSRPGSRFQGILGNPNTVGVLVGLLLPIAVWWFLHREAQVGLLVLFLFTFALYESGSRTGLLTGSAGVGYVVFSMIRPTIASSRVGLWRASAVFVIAAGLLLGLIYEIRPDTFWILGGRSEHWGHALDLIGRRPWLGYGFGTEDYLLEWAEVTLMVAQGAYMHSTYVGLAAQLGLIGAAIFIVPWLGFLASEGFRQWKNPETTSPFRTALLGCMVAGAVAMVSETWAFSAGNGQAFLFWILFVALVRIRKIAETAAAGASRGGVTRVTEG